MLLHESWRAQEADGVPVVSGLEGQPTELQLALGSGEPQPAALGTVPSVRNGQAVTLSRRA